MNAITINNHNDTLYYSTIDHDCYCEHRVPKHGLMYVRSGSLRIDRAGESLVVGAGEYVFLKRDCRADITKLSDGDTPYRSIAITLSRSFLKEFYSHLANRQVKAKNAEPFRQAAFILRETVPLKSLFQSLIPYADKNLAPSDDILGLKLHEAVICLVEADGRMYPTLFDFNETWKIDLLEFMEQNYTQDMSLEEFAVYTGRSLATFKRDFSRISDLSPQKWLIVQRLNKAKQMICEQDVSISDVCMTVGFKNKSHFFSAFKQQFGCTPGELRQLGA